MNIRALIEKPFEEGTHEKYLPPSSDTSLLSQKTNALEDTEYVNEMKNGDAGSDLVSQNVVQAILSSILPMFVEMYFIDYGDQGGFQPKTIMVSKCGDFYKKDDGSREYQSLQEVALALGLSIRNLLPPPENDRPPLLLLCCSDKTLLEPKKKRDNKPVCIPESKLHVFRGVQIGENLSQTDLNDKVDMEMTVDMESK
ncbi:hypothetical protein QYM36_007983 [Artemia franciscana]|uniref:Uncharacterized protein n=1 Tax=Artemia franciscana TaxID=6661 RepID=A0AA88IAE0_ARTSF|nr:hypothetical protein QYM36_007983 [Artemia franciscana]